MGTKLNLAPGRRVTRPMSPGHADTRTDWAPWAAPLPRPRAQHARNGLRWVAWHWLDVHRANAVRNDRVLAAVARAREAADARNRTLIDDRGFPAADYLSEDMALDVVREARQGAA